MNEEDRLEEESERLQKEYEKRRSERLRGGATDEQINQAYKERKILDQQDPRTDEEFLKKRAEEGPDAGEVAKGIGFEIAAGLATDIATKPLLALPPLYALANFVSGAAANLIAQKLRGETKLSLGEILGSGAVGIIPGSQIKTGKTLSKIVGEAASGQRVLVSGAAQGLGAESIRVGIDEQRLLTAKEAALAGGTGGLVSRGFMEILNARKPALDYINRVLTKNVGPTGAPAADVFAAGSVGAAKVNPQNQQLGISTVYKKGDLGKQLLQSNKPVVNMTKRDGVVTLDQATITQAEKIIDDLEAFHDKGLAGNIPKWKLDRPTSQYRGLRRIPYTKPDGTQGQLYFNWSASKQTYVARDVDKLIKAKMNRAVWNVPQSGKKGAVQSVYKTSKAANAALNQKLLNLFDDDPELMQKIIGDTKQIVYVEHIHPGRSPYWNKTRAFGPGDPENLLVIEDTIFPKVKTAIEKQLYDSGRYKNIYADMDAAGDILLKDATTDKLIGRIPGITNQSQVKAGIYRALTGKQPMDLVDIDPTLRPYLAKLHGFDTEDFGRLKDVQAGIPSKAQDKFEEISRLLESKEVQLEASKTGIGKKLSVIKEDALAKEIKALRKEIEQLRLFDTGGEGTGLRTQKQKIKIKKPSRVKKSVGVTEESVQIPIEYQGPKYKK